LVKRVNKLRDLFLLALGFSNILSQDSFSFVIIPDTQYYTSNMNGGSKEILNAQTEWIIDNQNSKNIVFVAHLGDIVQFANLDESAWIIASDAMSKLDSSIIQIPYGLAVGNHDLGSGGAPGESEYFNKYFGVNRYNNQKFYGGHYKETNDNHYILFSASGIDFISIFIEWNKDTNSERSISVLNWVEEILTQNKDRNAIIVAHNIIYWTLDTFSAQGDAIYDRIKNHPNVFLMLSGHVYGPGEKTKLDIYNGNKIYSLLSNYQDYPNGGNGYLRIMEFSKKDKLINVKTYSPYLDLYEKDNNSEFSIPWDPGLLKIKTSDKPDDFNLLNNYPNPFNISTKIHFNIEYQSNVVINIFDIYGNKLLELMNEKLPPGYHNINWKATKPSGQIYPSGIYFYQLRTENYLTTKKMILLK